MMKSLKKIYYLLLLIVCNQLLSSCEIKENKTENNSKEGNGKLLGAYYFGAGYFTLVPENIRHDLDEMRSLGTDFICITATQSDFRSTKPNIDFLIEEIHKRDMKVFMVPSRIAGITAGQPLEPSIFPYHHLDTWVLMKDGTPLVRKGLGAMSSFYHPKVKEYFINTVHKMMDTWEIDGIIWDEPKSTVPEWQDFSPKALENNPDASYEKYLEDFAKFFSEINQAIKEKNPDITILFFDEACRPDLVPEKTATIQHLDYFGVDGSPYPTEKSPHEGNRATKVLPVYGERFLEEGRKNGLKTFVLVENQKVTGDEIEAMEETFPEILKMDIDMMLYYYYGRYKVDTEQNMDVVKKYVKEFKALDH